MATIIKQFTKTEGEGNSGTMSVKFTVNDITVTGATITIPNPTITISNNMTGLSDLYGGGNFRLGNSSLYGVFSRPYAKASKGVWYSASLLRVSRTSMYTTDYFNSSNPNIRTVYLTGEIESFTGTAVKDDFNWAGYQYSNSTSLGNIIALTLDAPPILDDTHNTVSSMTFEINDNLTNAIYANLTTAKVSVAHLSAQYGGSITSVSLQINDQIVSRNDAGVLAIDLDTVGTFTPIVIFTDSRGQTTTKQLESITVNAYNLPSINNCMVERTIPKTGELIPIGKPDDEGESATITTILTYTDGIVTNKLVEPIITVVDEDGNIQSPSTIDWYLSRNTSTGELSNKILWNDNNISSGSTVYGLIRLSNDFDTQKSYTISITPRDNLGYSGTTISQTLAPAFYTIDFLAGGHGIAFGQPCKEEGFFCNMDAHFIDHSKVMHRIFDIFYPKGSYYETDLSPDIPSGETTPTSADLEALGTTWFNPNYAWGGTWVMDSAGKVTVAQDTNDTSFDTIGETGGSKYIQAHTHGFTQPTIHSNISATVSYGSGSASRPYTSSGTGTTTGWNWATGGTVNEVQDSSHNAMQTGNAGNMPPYIVVYRWHRTA